jgi:hypothetical protein
MATGGEHAARSWAGVVRVLTFYTNGVRATNETHREAGLKRLLCKLPSRFNPP